MKAAKTKVLNLLLFHQIGGWNISGGFDVRAWNLQSKLTVMHNRYNRGGLFEWSVAQDEKNSSRMVLDLQQGGFVMPRDYYMNKTDDDSIMVAYLEFMVKIGVLLGGEEAATRAQMKDVLRLERAMAKVKKRKDLKNVLIRIYISISIFLFRSSFHPNKCATTRRPTTR